MNYGKIQAAFEAQDCSILEPTSIEDLQEVLSRHAIAHHAWGQGPTKPVTDLFTEIINGESQLLEPADRSILGRMVSVAAIDVYATVDKWRFKLFEERQVFRNGTERTRSLETSLSEKIMGDEDPEDAALRGMAEELHVAYDGVLRRSSSRLIVKDSSASYPGLLSVYRVHPFEVQFSSAEYNAEGYAEVQPDKTTYFAWRPLR